MSNIMIIGATGGIGNVVCEYLFECGHSLLLVGRDSDKLCELQNRLGGSYAYRCDLSNPAEISKLYDYIDSIKIKLDGLVYCAGINMDIPVRLNNLGALNNVINVNYISFVEALKYFLRKRYSNDNSSVVVLSSSAVEECPEGMCTYVASKAAIEATVRISAKEAAGRRIRINAIRPGFVDTNMLRQSTYVDMEKVLSKQKEGLIDPLHIAYLIEFLLSRRAEYITGSIIPIMGST